NLNFAFDLGSKVPAAIKLSGSFPHELIPANCEANWVSHNNELVETILFFGKLGTQGKRSAVLLGQENLEFSGSDEQAEIQDLGAFIHDPNPALVRSHLLGGFASENNLWGLSKSIAFLSSNSEIHSPWLRGFKVLEVLSLDPKRISKRLQELGIGILEIKKRGVDTTPEELRKKLRLKGKVSATLILTKLGEDRRAILCQPIG
ncbi:MAG: SAM-dependent methyltransferase, partial [Aquiluna sp.]|nr:SAM-dependent methyltransferase [Aquiluna sp.]